MFSYDFPYVIGIHIGDFPATLKIYSQALRSRRSPSWWIPWWMPGTPGVQAPQGYENHGGLKGKRTIFEGKRYGERALLGRRFDWTPRIDPSTLHAFEP